VFITRCVPDLDLLPAECAELFAAAADNFFATAAWWRSMLAAGMPDGAEACFLLCTDEEPPVAIFPLQRLDGGRALQSLTNPYTCLWQPLFAIGLDAAAVCRAGEALGRFCRGWPVVRLEALAEDFPPLEPLLAGVRRQGLLAGRYLHFGNWYEPVGGRSWEQYLAARPGALRETIRRKLRRAQATLQIVAAPDAAEAGVAAYEEIYARSWKVPEPFPRFNAEMMRQAAAQGALRLGLLHAHGRAVAAQIWIVLAGRATVLKLAHDEADKALSPGTVLTALMLRELIDREHVTELDFGRGDDAYKRLWVTQRQQRIGVMLINPLRPRGLMALARQWFGAARRRVIRAH
jgi:CelD/BcsL family acetyltransferase involved in cellulose biosynthesis